MDIILVAGLWLPSSIWSEVASSLDALGHRTVSVALPGVDDGDRAATLEHQVAAVVAAVDAAERPLVVGHSAASAIAWIVADRRPDAVAGVALVGGFPLRPGQPYAPDFPVVDGAMPFPGWDTFEGPDSDDLDEDARARLDALSVPVPIGVAHAMVELTDDRRYDVPMVLVCPEYDPAQAQSWVAAGELPEVTRASRVSYVDIDSGHWPMVTRPGELAALLHAIAEAVR
jgi:pimeloyl-ACP methyl ester carboxylesterase